MRRGPRGPSRRILRPMNQRRLIAPMQQFPHSPPMSPSNHEPLHISLRSPKGRSPKGVPPVPQQFNPKIPLRLRSLPRRPNRVNEKHGQKAPGADAEPSDGDEGHISVQYKQY